MCRFVQLFAYVGTCVELLDQLTQGDRDAVKERVKWGREVSRKRKQESVVQYTTNVAGTQSGDRAESSTPGLLNQGNDSLIDSMTAAVRIRIILPGVDGKEQRQRSDSRSPTKRPTTSRPAHIDMELPLELDDKSDSSVRVSVPCQAHPSQSCPPCLGQKESSSKHDYSVPAPPTLHTPELVAEQTFISKVETEAGRAKNDTTKQIFVSSLSSVPSSFNKAKPRVYRNRFNPTDAMKKQTQCNVISSGESTAEADNKFCFAETSNQITTRNSIVISKQGVRAECGPQEKVSVVSLADLDDESVLMLDFRATSRPRRQISSNEAYERAVKGDTTQFNVRFLAWSGLTEAQRRLELMAATKSRCVQEDAARDEIIIPSLKDFDSSEVKVQLSVHAFARWFSALQNQHQWIRERFLLEELVFVAEESTVHSEMVLKGLPVPSSECIGVSSSREWYAFVLWYSYGRQSVPGGGDTENPTLFKERLEARGHFLKQRLQIVEDVERKLVEDKLLAGAERRAFIFEHFKWPSSEESENAMSWEHTSLANREKEVALALLDPDIHIVAMTQEIELPDLSGASLDDFDLLALAGKFVPWWKAAGNKLRQEFLNKEVEEAAADASIRELLAQELGDEDGAELSSEDFLKAYLKSDQARLTFLKRKLFYMKRKSRIASVAKYGKPPAPIVFETLPRPLSVPFRFPDLEPPPAEEETETKEDSLNRLADENSAEEKLLITETADKQAEDDKLIRLDGEEELKKTALELEMMTVEDALSREYNAQMVEVESDDDDNGKPLTPPKRTDFSHSYFFGNLPQRFRIPQSGWHSGSGIDNGDEEIEEEEQLEQERERQRLLDLQEAERLAEEEKRAERARIEKEQEDKALQMRRVHQVELRKVLIHQSELEAKRRAERELRCISSESEKMLAEEIKEKQRLEQLVREQLEMEREDQLSSQLRKELRDATARAKRLQLSEQALMRAEDNRSQVVEKERMLRERDEEERRVYLTELYTSFEPFFASTNEPSEEFLPSIQRRCLERERRKRVRVKTAPYTVPYAETLVMDEVQQEPYLARDSRKFNTLIGLPVRSSHGRVRTAHIPSENEIVRLQRKAQLLDDEDRVETPLVAPPASPSLSPSPLPALAPQRLRQKTRARHKKPQLPDLVSWKESSEMLTDINEACNTLSPEAKRSHHTKTKASESSNQRQQAALPFFRGNMVIRGESKPTRAKDYSYRS